MRHLILASALAVVATCVSACRSTPEAAVPQPGAAWSNTGPVNVNVWPPRSSDAVHMDDYPPPAPSYHPHQPAMPRPAPVQPPDQPCVVPAGGEVPLVPVCDDAG